MYLCVVDGYIWWVYVGWCDVGDELFVFYCWLCVGVWMYVGMLCGGEEDGEGWVSVLC